MQPGNFYFLQSGFPALYAPCRKAEMFFETDAEACAIFCRKALEEMVHWMFETDRQLETIFEEDDNNLNALMYKPGFMRVVGKALLTDITLIRKAGNNAAHANTKKVSVNEAFTCTVNLHAFAQWLAGYYGDTVFNDTFSATLVNENPKPEVVLLQKEVSAEPNIVKTASGIVYHPPSEKLTRQNYIDILLQEAGWNVGSAQTVAEYQLKHSANGLDRADYVLFGNDGKALAVVEAKKATADGRDKGLHQAKRYADALETEFGRRPIIFVSNGFEHFLWDDLNYPYREVQGFYGKEDLERLIHRRLLETPLANQAVNVEIAGRAYQIEAIQRAKEALQDKRRDLLFIMATGSGKTRTAAALVDVLTKASKVKRILFLADRNALVSQAKTAFNNYLPQLTAVNLCEDKTSEQVRMVFSTYQTLINCIDTELDGNKRLFTIGYFDLVIFDEVHRSIYQKYKAIFNYFDAIRLGLTATPKAETQKDTYELFHLEPDNPTFAYELNVAVAEGYLTPPTAMIMPLKFPRQGIKYADLSAADKEAYEAEFEGDSDEMPDEIDSAALNDWLFNENTVNQVLQLLMDKGLRVNSNETVGKTIIFAKNQNHARFIETCFNKLYPQEKSNFLQVVTHKSEQPQTVIDQFKLTDKRPQIVVSVDMLDTGIDVPDILNLVFFKAVKSSSKYWQMVGRGTRLRPDIFGPGQDKTTFYFFDYCGNIEFFGDHPEGIQPSETFSLTQRVFMLKMKLASTLEQFAADDELNDYRSVILDELHSEISKLSPDSFVNRPHLRLIEAFANRNHWNTLTEDKIREVNKNLTPLLLSFNTDFDARRFDAVMYRLIDAFLNAEKTLPKLITVVKNTASALLKQTSLPQVMAKKELLKTVLNDTFWQNTDAKGLDNVREEIRLIYKFLEKDNPAKHYTNFIDELTGEIEIRNILTPLNHLEAYRKKVTSFIRKNANYLVIDKIKHNQPISTDELELIKKLLFAEDPETAEHLDEVLKGQDFMIFIRSIIGLDAKVAKELFADFINRPGISAAQISFIDTLINFLTQNGHIDKNMLFERPFTDLNQQGVLGVFKDDDAVKIISIIDGFNQNSQKLSQL